MSDKKCAIEGCPKPYSHKGYCRMHLARIQRHGDSQTRLPNSTPRPISEVLAEYLPFPMRVEGACWLWQGTLDRRGYGLIGRAGRIMRAHRFVYEQMVGPIPPGKLLRHSCDTPPCCNPDHLGPGTDAQNIADMVARGRQAKGSRHRSAKLTEETVLEIRRIYRTGTVTGRELAERYGLTPSPMSQLLRGITWRHVPMGDV